MQPEGWCLPNEPQRHPVRSLRRRRVPFARTARRSAPDRLAGARVRSTVDRKTGRSRARSVRRRPARARSSRAPRLAHPLPWSRPVKIAVAPVIFGGRGGRRHGWSGPSRHETPPLGRGPGTLGATWWWHQDVNPRPSGHEPDREIDPSTTARRSSSSSFTAVRRFRSTSGSTWPALRSARQKS